MGSQREWFGEWFDSKYYHILYKHRDIEEARGFIDNLAEYLPLKEGDSILDLACGRGRFAIYLSEKGYYVKGIDLSRENIEEAKKFESERLEFLIHDMREVFCRNCFDYVFNMFTSFGYFDTREEDKKVVISAVTALKSKGKLLIDFLNPYMVIHNLVPEEEMTIDGIRFYIRRKLSMDGYILKDIDIDDNGDKFHFQEKVKAIQQHEFMEYFEHAGLKLIEVFGDYRLKKYIPGKSERMIFLLEKRD